MGLAGETRIKATVTLIASSGKALGQSVVEGAWKESCFLMVTCTDESYAYQMFASKVVYSMLKFDWPK
jgi:hypothetical protein